MDHKDIPLRGLWQRRLPRALARLYPSAYQEPLRWHGKLRAQTEARGWEDPRMMLDLTAALLVALAVGVWKLLHRRTSSPGGPFPNVPDAPSSAEPITEARMYGDGLGGYSPDVRASEDQMASERRSRD